MDSLEQFDHLVIFNSNDRCLKSIRSIKGFDYALWLQDLESVIQEALGARIREISSLNIPLRSKTVFLAIGLKLDPSFLYNPVIRGPRSGTDAGKNFRTFWGDKSEIRHLDGDLFECVVWNSSQDITSQVIDYVLSGKFAASNKGKSSLWHQIPCTRLSDLLRSLSPSYSHLKFPTRASTLHMLTSLEKMKTILSGFNKHLPLNIMGVQPISAEFRGTSVFAPIITIRDDIHKKKSANNPWYNVHHPLRPIYAILQIQSSGKWPKDNYSAFLHMKRLFLLRIKELLVHIGVPSKVVSTGMLDVFINGLIFRLSFCHNFELKLLRRSLGLVPPKKNKTAIDDDDNDNDNPIAFEPEPLVRWLTFNQRLPDVAGQLVAIARSHINTFPDACRLAKRWLSAHGFPVIQCPDLSSEPTAIGCESISLGDGDLGESECRLSEIAIELMIVHAGGFTKAVSTPSYTAGLPGASDEGFLSASPLATFLRFLRLLYTFDWEKDILLVDLNEEFTGKVGLERAMVAVTEFKIAPRDQLPAMVIGTPLDPKGTHWTHGSPSVEGLNRLQVLAMHSHELLRAMLVAGADLTDLKAVFRPDLTQMDVLIKLRPSVYKTRILEAVDLEVPSWAMKKLDSADLETPGVNEGTQESEPVTLDLPNPGASYWPAGYLCDPVTWILRHIQNRLAVWNIFEFLWDRHSGRWIGLRVKDAAKCARLCELKPFNETTLCQASGFARHRESVSNLMGLVVDVELALQALQAWGSEMLESVRLQRPEAFKMAGVELQVPEVEIVSRLNLEKPSGLELEQKEEHEQNKTVARKKKIERAVKKAKRVKFQP